MSEASMHNLKQDLMEAAELVNILDDMAGVSDPGVQAHQGGVFVSAFVAVDGFLMDVRAALTHGNEVFQQDDEPLADLGPDEVRELVRLAEHVAVGLKARGYGAEVELLDDRAVVRFRRGGESSNWTIFAE